MKLVTIKFEHYSPKDSESGIKEYVITDDHEAVTDYVDCEHLCDVIEDDEADEDPDIRWAWFGGRPLPEGREKYGITSDEDEDGNLSGTYAQLSRWLKRTSWDDGDIDGYYGETHYDWSEARDISESDAEVLVRLGIAKKLNEEVK